MYRLVRVALLLLAAVAAAGCGIGTSTAAHRSSASASATQAPPTPARPSPTLDLAALKSRVKAAMIPANAFRDSGAAAPQTDEYGQWAVTVMCGKPLLTDVDMMTSYQRLWRSDRIFVQNFVHGYSANTAARTVAEVRQLHSSCKQYQPGGADNSTRTVLGPLVLPTVPADDAFGYCEDAGKATLCFAFLAKGNLVSVIIAAHTGSSLKDTQGDLLAAVPMAATAMSTRVARNGQDLWIGTQCSAGVISWISWPGRTSSPPVPVRITRAACVGSMRLTCRVG